ELIAYGTEDLKERVRALTDGKGADVIYDPVGGDATKAVLSAINWRGRLLIVGFASGTIPDIPANRALIKGCDIVGIFWGDYIRREPERFAQDFAELTRLYETGRIKPLVSATYPLE